MERNILRKQRTSAFPTVSTNGLTRTSTLMEPTLATSRPARRSFMESSDGDNHSSRLNRLYSQNTPQRKKTKKPKFIIPENRKSIYDIYHDKKVQSFARRLAYDILLKKRQRDPGMKLKLSQKSIEKYDSDKMMNFESPRF